MSNKNQPLETLEANGNREQVAKYLCTVVTDRAMLKLQMHQAGPYVAFNSSPVARSCRASTSPGPGPQAAADATVLGAYMIRLRYVNNTSNSWQVTFAGTSINKQAYRVSVIREMIHEIHSSGSFPYRNEADRRKQCHHTGSVW